MRKLFLGITFAAASFGASAACTLNFETGNAVITKVLQAKGWNIKNYEGVCLKLAKANAAFFIRGGAEVLGGQSIGWAAVSVVDQDLPIFSSSHGGNFTSTDSFASQDRANTLLYDAINRAVEISDIDKSLMALDDARAKIRARR